MDLGDLVYSENMGAYCAASSTFFNGFPPAKVVHVNQAPQEELGDGRP
jgi:ornithine decarboxylase